MRRRVAITGVGVVCPLGRRIEEVWSRIVAGESSVAAGTFKNPATGTELTVPIARLPDSALDSPARDVAGLTDRFHTYGLAGCFSRHSRRAAGFCIHR
ncbi:MAG: hypothetical protein IPO75_08835 [Betaproteobacteria bacterium]|nr:hypothetical protein [Betaproteobacteria bacterium]